MSYTPPNPLVGQFLATGNSSFFTNESIAVRCRTRTDLIVNRIGCVIAISAGNVDLGIFSDDGDGSDPLTKLASTGSVASPGTGKQLFTIPTTIIPAGAFWIAIGISSASLSLRYGNTAASFGMYDPTFDNMQRPRRHAAFPLPATWTPGGAETLPPVLWVEKV